MQADAGEGRQPRLSASLVNWLTLLFLVVIWGSTFAGISIGVKTIDPAWLVTGRLIGAAIFTAIWLGFASLINKSPRGDARPRITWRAVAWYAFVGVAGTAIPFFLFAVAAKTTGSAVMAICNGATPFGTALLAHYILRDRLTKRRAAGVMMGFLGLAVLVAPHWGDGAEGGLFGISIAIFGALLYSVGNVATRMAPVMSPSLSSFIIVASGGVTALAVAVLTAPFPVNPSTASLTAMVLLALLPTALAMVLYVWLIQRAGPVFVSFTTYLSPLWATGVGIIFLSEPLLLSMVGALALILSGVAVANARPLGKPRGQA